MVKLAAFKGVNFINIQSGIQRYFIINNSNIKVFRILFVILCSLFFLEVYLALSALFSLFPYEHSLQTYYKLSKFLVLDDQFIWLLTTISPFFLFLILINKFTILSFLCLTVIQYLVFIRFSPFYFSGQKTLFWITIVGAVLPHKKLLAKSITGLPVIFIYLLIFSIYIQSGTNKTDPAWISDFTAVEIVTNSNVYSNFIGLKLSNYTELCKFLTIAVLAFEIIGSVIFITGFLFRYIGQYFKFFFAIGLLIFHICLLVFLNLGLFPLFALLFPILILSIPNRSRTNMNVHPSWPLKIVLYFLIFQVTFDLFNPKIYGDLLLNQKYSYFAPRPFRGKTTLSIYQIDNYDHIINRFDPLNESRFGLIYADSKTLEYLTFSNKMKLLTWGKYYCNTKKPKLSLPFTIEKTNFIYNTQTSKFEVKKHIKTTFNCSAI